MQACYPCAATSCVLFAQNLMEIKISDVIFHWLSVTRYQWKEKHLCCEAQNIALLLAISIKCWVWSLRKTQMWWGEYLQKSQPLAVIHSRIPFHVFLPTMSLQTETSYMHIGRGLAPVEWSNQNYQVRSLLKGSTSKPTETSSVRYSSSPVAQGAQDPRLGINRHV